MNKNGDIKIKHGSSSLSEFIERPLPSDAEVEAFDQYVAHEAKEEEVKSSLAKIYQNDKGEAVNVQTLTFKKRRGWLFKLFTFLVVVFALGGALYAAYNYVSLKLNLNKQPVSLAIDAKKEVAAGEEFNYYLTYKNEDKVAIKNIEIKIAYPDNFIFLEADPKPSLNNNTWNAASLGSRRSDFIRIKGKLAGTLNSDNIILADMTYTPENFSSEFKKSADFSIAINDLGLDISLANSSSALINEENEISVIFKAKDRNYLNTFRLTASHPDEVEIIKLPDARATSSPPAAPLIKAGGQDSWLISNLGKNENTFKIKFKVKEKKQPAVSLAIKFEYPYAASAAEAPKYYVFYENSLTYEVIKSDLNINLIINGSPLDQGVDFGQTLNYSVSYANKGDSEMRDVIIMAVLESDFLDWQSLNDKNSGAVSGNTISWSKTEIPALAELASGGQGIIDFSISLKNLGPIDLAKAYQVKSYVSYSIAGKSAAGQSQSNTIASKINSDLNLDEQLRYFNSDNIAVGSGPVPPKVGQITGLKVYWTISNSLHELNNLRISAILPAGVSWGAKNSAAIGTIAYDSQSNKAIWQIGRLPAGFGKTSGEFNISVAPTDANLNQIMVILPGTAISAKDSVTGAQLDKILKAKTSKLENDNMASGDGIIQ
ncbi:MAG: hypothetical protein Q7R92_04420 [bacterium]|nr:hypothetical protein [bacterium]